MTSVLAAEPTAQVADELRRRLERELVGGADDVQFDDYSRHLFSRDASMYTIMPLGVAFPRHADDVVAAVRAAHDLGVPVLPRGAGTSLAGQTVGPGLVLDLSRHMHEIVSIDPEARTARVQMGVVQDDLNRAAAPYGLMFGPDTSTSNRATIGGMVGNNSAGSGSVRYGMTIDHVRALDVVLSDGSRARLEPVDEAERRRRAEADTLEGALYRDLPELVEANRAAIETGFPPHWRRACGYRLDRLLAGVAGPDAFDLAKFVVGAEGTLVIATEAVVDLVPKPPHTVFGVGHFDSVQGAIDATARRPHPRSGTGRDARPHHPRPVPAEDRVRRARRDPRGRPRGAVVRVVHRRRPRRADQPARPAHRAVGGKRPRLPHAARRDSRAAGLPAQGAQGRPRTADGQQPRRQPAARVHRGHRGSAGAPGRVHAQGSRRCWTPTA